MNRYMIHTYIYIYIYMYIYTHIIPKQNHISIYNWNCISQLNVPVDEDFSIRQYESEQFPMSEYDGVRKVAMKICSTFRGF